MKCGYYEAVDYCPREKTICCRECEDRDKCCFLCVIVDRGEEECKYEEEDDAENGDDDRCAR